MRVGHFLPAIALAFIFVATHTPFALADTISATASTSAPGCSASDTLSGPGSIHLTCGAFPQAYATFDASLGASSGSVAYAGSGAQQFGTPAVSSLSATMDISGEIMAPGSSGTSTIAFVFTNRLSQQGFLSCVWTFQGQANQCVTGSSFGSLETENFQFVVQNGVLYPYDLRLGAEQNYPNSAPGYDNFTYSLSNVVPSPAPEPLSLSLVLSGFLPFALGRIKAAKR